MAPEARFDPELAARFRAALGYANMNPKDAAEALGQEIRHIYRLRNARAEIKSDLMELVLEATKVPRWFMEQGFDPSPQTEDPVMSEHVETLRNEMDTVLRVLGVRATYPGINAEEPP